MIHRKSVRQVGYLPELYEDARFENYYFEGLKLSKSRAIKQVTIYVYSKNSTVIRYNPIHNHVIKLLHISAFFSHLQGGIQQR
jgi:hypothetical protein